MTLTGGEKYIVKTMVMEINKIYSSLKADFDANNVDMNKLYDCTLVIFTKLSNLTINIIDTNPVIRKSFNELQEIHKYSSCNSSNQQQLLDFFDTIPQLVDALIKLVNDDTSARDTVLRQIMEELGIVDPNAKKKKSSVWDN